MSFINIFEVSADHLDAFITEWEQRAALLSTKPGFIDSRLHRAHRAETRFQLVNCLTGRAGEAWEAGTADPEFRKRTRAVRAGLAGAGHLQPRAVRRRRRSSPPRRGLEETAPDPPCRPARDRHRSRGGRGSLVRRETKATPGHRPGVRGAGDENRTRALGLGS
ncbi:antibiotic biosynthesis monooxygenase [Streptomyces thinghirensis]|nr:antibiotic biosynthesis monooxygenase [Streptomyces thinghirensis]